MTLKRKRADRLKIGDKIWNCGKVVEIGHHADLGLVVVKTTREDLGYWPHEMVTQDVTG